MEVIKVGTGIRAFISIQCEGRQVQISWANKYKHIWVSMSVCLCMYGMAYGYGDVRHARFQTFYYKIHYDIYK